MTKKLLMGNEAMAHAALEAGVGVVAGYPGTPSSEIVETVARLQASGSAQGVHVEWSTNEKAALELLFGASLAGKRGLFTCKQMGLNVASDALLSLNYVSVRAGLVLVVADDPGPISSQTEQDTRRFAAFAKVPVLDPATPEQAFDMVRAAFELSERFHTPVIVRPTTRVDHASAFIDVADETTALPLLNAYGQRPGEKPKGADTAGLELKDIADSPTQAIRPIGEGLSEEEKARTIPGGFVYDARRWVIFPRRSYQAHGEINERLRDMAAVFSSEYPYALFNSSKEMSAVEPEASTRSGGRARVAPPAVFPESPTFGILAGGISAAYAHEALRLVEQRVREAGLRAPACRLMQVGTPYPFPEEAVAAFCEGLTDVLVVEELDHVLEDELLRFAGRTHATFEVHGKLSGEARDRGENDADDIAARVERFLGLTGRLSLHRARAKADVPRETRPVRGAHAAHARDTEATGREALIAGVPVVDNRLDVRLSPADETALPVRPPVLCAGCPHRASFHAVKMALGKTPAVLCGDIGCYTLGNAAPLNAVDTCLCMGAGITMAQGIAVADPGKKAIAFVGDSTFFASGMTGLANAAYNGHDITVMVLDNSTTAMTGAQPHPGTGQTLMGTKSRALDIEAVLNANGFERVFCTNAFDRDASVVAVRAALLYKGPSAVIFQGTCAQLVPPGEPVEVNPDACTGCKRCINTIGCPAISFDGSITGMRSRDRGQAVIDADLCVGCGLCVQVCPSKAIEAPFELNFLGIEEPEREADAAEGEDAEGAEGVEGAFALGIDDASQAEEADEGADDAVAAADDDVLQDETDDAEDDEAADDVEDDEAEEDDDAEGDVEEDDSETVDSADAAEDDAEGEEAQRKGLSGKVARVTEAVLTDKPTTVVSVPSEAKRYEVGSRRGFGGKRIIESKRAAAKAKRAAAEPAQGVADAQQAVDAQRAPEPKRNEIVIERGAPEPGYEDVDPIEFAPIIGDFGLSDEGFDVPLVSEDEAGRVNRATVMNSSSPSDSGPMAPIVPTSTARGVAARVASVFSRLSGAGKESEELGDEADEEAFDDEFDRALDERLGRAWQLEDEFSEEDRVGAEGDFAGEDDFADEGDFAGEDAPDDDLLFRGGAHDERAFEDDFDDPFDLDDQVDTSRGRYLFGGLDSGFADEEFAAGEAAASDEAIAADDSDEVIDADDFGEDAVADGPSATDEADGADEAAAAQPAVEFEEADEAEYSEDLGDSDTEESPDAAEVPDEAEDSEDPEGPDVREASAAPDEAAAQQAATPQDEEESDD